MLESESDETDDSLSDIVSKNENKEKVELWQCFTPSVSSHE